MIPLLNVPLRVFRSPSRPSPISVGVSLPSAAGRPEDDLVVLARGAEQLGLDSLWLTEHASPIEALAELALRTSGLRLGTTALQLRDHRPELLARRLATLADLCHGRLLVGVTIPRVADGFAAQLAALQAVCGPGVIPMLVGCRTLSDLKLAARVGDGLHVCRNDIRQVAIELEFWRELVAAEGRNPSSLPVVVSAGATLGGTAARTLFRRDTDSWPERFAALRDLGVDHVVLNFDERAAVADVLEAMARLDLPAARSAP